MRRKTSICIPCGPGHVWHLNRTLFFYNLQAADIHEVVVCFDGFGGEGVDDYPWLKKVVFQRPGGSKLAHRNHARNAAAAAATGDYLWFLDADAIPGPNLVAHGCALVGPDVSIFPVMFAVQGAYRQRWEALPTSTSLLREVPMLDSVYPKTGHRFVPSARPQLDTPPYPGLDTEGYPLLSRELFGCLGGFPEEYRGWGRNKEAFVLKLRALAPDHEYRLMVSSAVYLQPHDYQKGSTDQHSRIEATVAYQVLTGHRNRWLPDLQAAWAAARAGMAE